MLLCLSTLLSIPCSIYVRQSCSCRCVAKMYTRLKVCFSSFRALSSLMYVFFSSPKKKKMGIFGGGNGPWKNLYFQVVYTQTHKKRDCSDFERERRSGIHIPNSISLSLPFKHVTFAPDSPEKLFVWGCVFFVGISLRFFVQSPTRVCVFSFLKTSLAATQVLFFWPSLV